MEVEFKTAALAAPAYCRVFVTHFDRNADWSDLDRFALETVPLYRGKTIFPDTAELAEETLSDLVQGTLRRKQFNSTRDYVCLAGDILIQAVAVSVISSHFGDFTALRFDKREGRYWPFKVRTGQP